MRTETKTYEVYKVDELSDKAKENVARREHGNAESL